MATYSPKYDDLRAFVRGELSEGEERRMYRWMVMCADPDLPTVLHNLRFEWEQQQRDAELSESAQELGALFLSLWEQQRALIDIFEPEPPQQSSLAYADISQSPFQIAEGVVLTRRNGGEGIVQERNFEVRLFATPTRRRVAAVVTTDAGEILPFPNMPLSPQEHRHQVGRTQSFTVDEAQGRVTFWYVGVDEPAIFGPQLPTSWQQLAPWLRRLAEADDAYVSAIRLTPRVLTDFYA